MKNNIELKLLVEQSIIEWRYKGDTFSLTLSEVDQVLVDQGRELIFILDQKKDFPERLTIITATGKIVSSFLPPDDGRFYYMTTDSKKEVLIVCVFTVKIDGWSDWHFSFHPQRKQLERLSPVY
ncbi:hypothetical protein [Type-F symbiont of Plautia stali]|uniref:hypothetical protein n=1 Tax=Pantoea anthophila TaxID=470931 RepID=UPI00073E96CE